MFIWVIVLKQAHGTTTTSDYASVEPDNYFNRQRLCVYQTDNSSNIGGTRTSPPKGCYRLERTTKGRSRQF